MEQTNNQQTQKVVDYFSNLQTQICNALENHEEVQKFSIETIPGPTGGVARPRVLEGGKNIEKAAVQFSHSVGAALPPAATERNPHLADHPFEAVAVSLIVHPVNPMAPTVHMNLRYFSVDADPLHWYFGGGYDLTPYYPSITDCKHWHEVAAVASEEHYATLKAACDDYFYLPHRQEARGIGGLFFDDWTHGGFDSSLTFVERIGDSFLPAYLPIFEHRIEQPYTPEQQSFQHYRRGRYAEFNLAFDRGTKYGLQSGRRIESVLASLPPKVAWRYNFQPAAGSPEAQLVDYYLQPKDWLSVVDKSGD